MCLWHVVISLSKSGGLPIWMLPCFVISSLHRYYYVSASGLRQCLRQFLCQKPNRKLVEFSDVEVLLLDDSSAYACIEKQL
jgi:hypothetical protein